MKKQFIGIILMLAALVSVVGLSASAAETVTLTVANVTADPGDEVRVDVTLSNNTGLAALKIDVAYDRVLTLTGVELNTDLCEMITAPEPYTNPQSIAFISPEEDMTADGLVATLVFKVSETAEYGYKANISVTYDPENVFDGTLTNVDLNIINGSVSDPVLYGDANGDGAINGKDVMVLRKYMANFDYDTGTSTVDISAGADANGDGAVNGLDVTLLRKYIANYDYDTGSSTVVLGPQ